jgi:hypothetical protein
MKIKTWQRRNQRAYRVWLVLVSSSKLQDDDNSARPVVTLMYLKPRSEWRGAGAPRPQGPTRLSAAE